MFKEDSIMILRAIRVGSKVWTSFARYINYISEKMNVV